MSYAVTFQQVSNNAAILEQAMNRVNASQNEYVCSYYSQQVYLRLPNGETRTIGIVNLYGQQYLKEDKLIDLIARLIEMSFYDVKWNLPCKENKVLFDFADTRGCGPVSFGALHLF